jgi:hypothetical protein
VENSEQHKNPGGNVKERKFTKDSIEEHLLVYSRFEIEEGDEAWRRGRGAYCLL